MIERKQKCVEILCLRMNILKEVFLICPDGFGGIFYQKKHSIIGLKFVHLFPGLNSNVITLKPKADLC